MNNLGALNTNVASENLQAGILPKNPIGNLGSISKLAAIAVVSNLISSAEARATLMAPSNSDFLSSAENRKLLFDLSKESDMIAFTAIFSAVVIGSAALAVACICCRSRG